MHCLRVTKTYFDTSLRGGLCMELLAIYYKMIVLEPLFFFFRNFSNYIKSTSGCRKRAFYSSFFSSFQVLSACIHLQSKLCGRSLTFLAKTVWFWKIVFRGQKNCQMCISGHFKNASNNFKLTICLPLKTGNNFVLLCENRKTHWKKVISLEKREREKFDWNSGCQYWWRKKWYLSCNLSKLKIIQVNDY